ncbi:hypothetical protein AVEN_106931-1 [Araneus ventricosus]|uniref:Uncharacterized protein n=1 Tax=Araneus ventricosus TaxID=182803 RepID=A0A4Y2JVF7_ARAVE|nr:hypothetical protein AVEN_106931-1 [Araneus ventricosus]
MQEKHVAQVAGTTTLVQIRNTDRQQFTSNNSNSPFGFRNTNSQQMTNNDSNSTFNGAQLTGFPARTADQTQVVPVDQYTTTRYRSASDSLLAHTAYRTPKRDSKDVHAPRRSTFTHSVILAHSLCRLARQAVTSHG